MILLLKILPFVKSNYKLIAFVVLIILVILLYVRGQSEKNRADQAERGRDAAIIMSNGWKKMSTVYKNKLGDEVIKTLALEVNNINLAALRKSDKLAWLNSDKFNGLKKNLSNLQSAESFTTEFEAKDVPEKIKYLPCKDSVKAFSFDLKDEWNDIHAVCLDTPKIEIRDKYYGVIELHRPKGWFWKFQWRKWEPVSEITNSNKLIKIDSVAVFVVRR